MKHAKFVSFTEIGAQTAAKAARLLPDFLCERYARTVDLSLSNTSLPRFAQQAMVDCDLIVFVGAAGIAVRAAAPYLAGKAYDPAVVVIDEQGRFVIPLLSGHLGGANELAGRLAEGLGATAVITTATDGRAVFAVDSWAKSHECVVFDPENIKYISGALLRGDTVGLRSAFPVDGLLPAHIDTKTAAESGFVIGFDTEVQPFPHTLHLVPRVISLGIGCRKGTDEETIRAAVNEALAAHGIDRRAVKCAASIDLKAEEAGLLAYCRSEGLSAEFYTADELRAVRGEFTPSEFVKSITGVDNVCERAALRNAETLLVKKTARSGVTVAAAAEHWEVRFA